MNLINLILLIMISGYFIIVSNASSSSTYISYVDDGLGFFKVRNLDTPPRQFIYVDHTLNINQGDTVIWENDADKTTFTILSEQNLWNSNIGYLNVGSKLNYKFDQPGTYDIYLKEYPSRKQTIFVNSLNPTEMSTPKTTSVPPKISVTTTSVPSEISVTTTSVPSEISATTTSVPGTETVDRKPQSAMVNSNLNPHISGTSIASIIVGILSIFIAYRVGK